MNKYTKTIMAGVFTQALAISVLAAGVATGDTAP